MENRKPFNKILHPFKAWQEKKKAKKELVEQIEHTINGGFRKFLDTELEPLLGFPIDFPELVMENSAENPVDNPLALGYYGAKQMTEEEIENAKIIYSFNREQKGIIIYNNLAEATQIAKFLGISPQLFFLASYFHEFKHHLHYKYRQTPQQRETFKYGIETTQLGKDYEFAEKSYMEDAADAFSFLVLRWLRENGYINDSDEDFKKLAGWKYLLAGRNSSESENQRSQHGHSDAKHTKEIFMTAFNAKSVREELVMLFGKKKTI